MTTITIQDIKNQIDNSPVTRFQVISIALCSVINMIDGFDMLVMAFTAAALSDDWGVTKTELGVLFGAGIAGMGLGSLIVAPYGDKFGRRTLTIVCLCVITTGMLVSALSQSVNQLIVLRFVTGLGIGGILANINILVAEYSNRKFRSFAISVLQSGHAIGAIVGGSISVYLINDFGWKAAYVFGGFLSLLMVPAALLFLPESLDFLMSKRPKGALKKINHVLIKCNREPLTDIPVIPIEERAGAGIKSLFVDDLTRNTLMLWLAYFTVQFSLYFVVSWTPKLLVDSGFSNAQGISGGVIFQTGALTGVLMLGYIATYYNLTRLTAVYIFSGFVMMLLFANASAGLTLLMIYMLVMGFFLPGALVGLYAITPCLYKAYNRSTGMGWAIGIGRIGAIISPVLAGVLLDWGWDNSVSFLLFAMPLLMATSAVLLIRLQREK